jgi:hypothetical protein
VNAGRNTQTALMPPDALDADELWDESADSEARFLAYVLERGIPLADFEDKA